MVNTGVDPSQNFLSEEYMNPDDNLHNAVKWIEAGLTYREMAFLLPKPSSGEEFLDISNNNLNLLIKKAVENGIQDVCKSRFVKAGATDILCEALIANDLNEYLESVDYSVTFCHSPQDEVVYYTNLPNITANPDYLQLIQDDPSNPGGFINPQGTHAEAGNLCLFGYLLPFVQPVNAVKTVLPVDEPLCYPSNEPSISADPTYTPSASPSKSLRPTMSPTKTPTMKPTRSPTKTPTMAPTGAPTTMPTASPTTKPTTSPTMMPTKSPLAEGETAPPTKSPTDAPVVEPTGPPFSPPSEAKPSAASERSVATYALFSFTTLALIMIV